MFLSVCLMCHIFDISKLHVFFLSPSGLVTTQTQAPFVAGLTRAPDISLDLLSAAGQGDFERKYLTFDRLRS